MHIVTLNTGLNTHTGGRISEVMKTIPGEKVIATYGDGLANISVLKLLAFHDSHGKLATVTAVRPPARFGELQIFKDSVVSFKEKPQTNSGWINGGLYVAKKDFFKFIRNDEDILE